jgi:predicted metalloprotease with PDZ domain
VSTQYDKGSLVLAALDAKIHRESGGEASLQDVFARMNAHPDTVTYAEFKGFVAAEAGTDLDDWLDRYVTTNATPDIPADRAPFALVEPTDTDGDGYTDDEDPAPRAETGFLGFWLARLVELLGGLLGWLPGAPSN